MAPDSSHHRPTRLGGVVAGVVGIAASLICTAAMTLPVLGAAGTAAAAGAQGAGGMDSMSSMDSMSGGVPGGVLGWLLTYGPPIVIVSVLLVTVSLALRRRLAAVPALGFGALLYWGMYDQPSFPVMYLALALTYAGWIATYLWARRATRRDAAPSPPGADPHSQS